MENNAGRYMEMSRIPGILSNWVAGFNHLTVTVPQVGRLPLYF